MKPFLYQKVESKINGQLVYGHKELRLLIRKAFFDMTNDDAEKVINELVRFRSLKPKDHHQYEIKKNMIKFIVLVMVIYFSSVISLANSIYYIL